MPLSVACSGRSSSNTVTSLIPFLSHSAGTYSVCCGPMLQYRPR